MKGKETARNIRLGLFVLTGTLFIIFAFYIIGDKQNLFGSTIQISSDFENVDGLQAGNNVRYGGINIGTVKSVKITSDSTIHVVMVIEDKTKAFIKNNSYTSIGTDGLMGNKLVNINPVSQNSPLINEGDILQSKPTVETEKMMNTLDRTNEDVSIIAKNLKILTTRLNNDNILWQVLMDSTLANNLSEAFVNIKLTGERTAIITGDLSRIVKDVKSGKGSIGALLVDTLFSHNLRQTLVNINELSDTLAYISGNLKYISSVLKNGEGSIGTLLMDTTFVHNLNESMISIKSGSEGFDETMEALKHNILLRRYFKKQEKKSKQTQ